MTKQVILYARISKEDQTTIDQQLVEMRIFCESANWRILSEFVDDRNYRATRPPQRGKIVNPSGERDDRPALLAALEAIRTGEPDAILCWRDDRLVRHPRVAVRLVDALETGDAQRKLNGGTGDIGIVDANGATLDLIAA